MINLIIKMYTRKSYIIIKGGFLKVGFNPPRVDSFTSISTYKFSIGFGRLPCGTRKKNSWYFKINDFCPGTPMGDEKHLLCPSEVLSICSTSQG